MNVERREIGRPRVLLADDYPEMLERVFQLLQGNFDVIGMAQDGEQAIASAVNLNPEVLVLDISMPFLNGFQVVSRQDCKFTSPLQTEVCRTLVE